MIPSLFVRGEARSNDLQCRVRWPFLFGEAGRDLVHTHDKGLCCKNSGGNTMAVLLLVVLGLGSYSKQAGDEGDLPGDVSLLLSASVGDPEEEGTGNSVGEKEHP